MFDPPFEQLSIAGFVEALISPSLATNHMRTRSMCHRADEARGVSLLFGTRADADLYTRRLRLPVTELPFDVDDLFAALKGTGLNGWPATPQAVQQALLDGHTFSSGLLGILTVLRTRPGQVVHILGMNFAPSAQDHLPDLEYAVVRKLVQRGQAAIHPPPSNLYRAVARIRKSWCIRAGHTQCTPTATPWRPLFSPTQRATCVLQGSVHARRARPGPLVRCVEPLVVCAVAHEGQPLVPLPSGPALCGAARPRCARASAVHSSCTALAPSHATIHAPMHTDSDTHSDGRACVSSPESECVRVRPRERVV
jgi:hypothetical protein